MSEFVPFNDISRVFSAHKKQLSSTLSDIAKSGRWLFGEYTQKFAEDFAGFCGAKYCLPVANGTDALELALRSVTGNTEKGIAGEVITVANAGGYATTACRIIGAFPVYADIQRENQLVDIGSLANCLGPRVKAVVLTHLYGGVVDVPKVRRVLKEKGYGHIPLIEDCAQAHGARIGDQRVGSLGDVATFSFYPTKNLGAMGDAGAIVTSDTEIFEKIRDLHQYGWRKKYRVHVPFGKNSRMDEMQAGILTCLLPHLDDDNNKRRDIYNQYRKAGSSTIRFLDYAHQDFVGHLAVVMTSARKEFMTFMEERGITVDIHYPLLDCDQPGWKDLPMRMDEEGGLAVSRQSVKEIVSLPCFPTLTESEINHVCRSLSDWNGG